MTRSLPETLPEFPAVEADTSGLQPIAEAWAEVFRQMRKAFHAGDYARAVDLGERFLQHDPTHASARLFVQDCRTILDSKLDEELTPMERVVVPLAPLEKLTSLRIEPRMAFLLSRVDGHTTVDELIDLAGMPRVDVLRMLASAVELGLVVLR